MSGRPSPSPVVRHEVWAAVSVIFCVLVILVFFFILCCAYRRHRRVRDSNEATTAPALFGFKDGSAIVLKGGVSTKAKREAKTTSSSGPN